MWRQICLRKNTEGVRVGSKEDSHSCQGISVLDSGEKPEKMLPVSISVSWLLPLFLIDLFIWPQIRKNPNQCGIVLILSFCLSSYSILHLIFSVFLFFCLPSHPLFKLIRLLHKSWRKMYLCVLWASVLLLAGVQFIYIFPSHAHYCTCVLVGVFVWSVSICFCPSFYLNEGAVLRPQRVDLVKSTDTPLECWLRVQEKRMLKAGLDREETVQDVKWWNGGRGVEVRKVMERGKRRQLRSLLVWIMHRWSRY